MPDQSCITNPKHPFVFIHGFKGCHLRRLPFDDRDEETGKFLKSGIREYITVGQLAGLTSSSIKLPIRWEKDEVTGTERQALDDLVPDGPLTHVLGSRLLSTVAGAGVYGKLLDWASEKYERGSGCVIVNADHSKLSFEIQVPSTAGVETESLHFSDTTDREKILDILKNKSAFAFCYDWRRDNEEGVTIFELFLKCLAQSRQQDGVMERLPQVVAHSNGGLITWAVLQRSPHLFHSALLAGVPFGPSLSFLKDLTIGTSNGGFDFRQFAPESLFTFPSMYCFVPTYPYTSEQRKLDSTDRNRWCNQDELLVGKDGAPVVPTVQWHRAEDWELHGLGLFALAWRSTKKELQRHRSSSVMDAPGSTHEAHAERRVSPPASVLDSIAGWLPWRNNAAHSPSLVENSNDDFVMGGDSEDHDSVLAHLQRCLDAAYHFRERYLVPLDNTDAEGVQEKPDNPPSGGVVQLPPARDQWRKQPKIAVLVGDELATKTKAMKLPEDYTPRLGQAHHQHFDFFSSSLNDPDEGGDGRVTGMNARPPRHPELRYTLYGCGRTHTNLLNDALDVERILLHLEQETNEIYQELDEIPENDYQYYDY